MSLTVSFTVSQSAIDPTSFTVTDTSAGTDVLVTARRITVQDAYGNYLTGNGTVNYDDWPYAQASITLDFLTQDTAVNIGVEWLDISNSVLYTLNNNYPLSEFAKQFFVYLVQLQGLKPESYQDSNYAGNLAVFWANIQAGDNQVTYGNDIAGAQNCYNRLTGMRLNQAKYF